MNRDNGLRQSFVKKLGTPSCSGRLQPSLYRYFRTLQVQNVNIALETRLTHGWLDAVRYNTRFYTSELIDTLNFFVVPHLYIYFSSVSSLSLRDSLLL